MSKKKTQKVLIPRGTINPDEDTLIEIPVNLKDQPIVIAKRTDDTENNFRLTNTSSTKSIRSRTLQLEDPGVLSVRSRSKVKDQHKMNEVFSPSGNSTFYETGNSSNLYQTAPDVPAAVANLDETEIVERKIIQKKLQDFQQARRELLLGTSSVATKSSQLIPQTNYENEPGISVQSAHIKSNLLHSSLAHEADSGQALNKTIKKPTHSSMGHDDVSPSVYNKSIIKPRSAAIGSEDDLTPAVNSIYVRPNSSRENSRRTGPIAPPDRCPLYQKHDAGTSHRRYEQNKSRQCKQVQTEVYNDDDDEEEDDSCLCLSKSTNSLTKSNSSFCKRR